MISRNKKRGALFGLCVFLIASTAGAQAPASEFPTDAKTQRVQELAEEVYERTQYERAFFIYRNELAPIGDKYAQYMVGFMYLNGKGVEEDFVAASAWYRLAAERDIPQFIKVRDQLMRGLDDDQRAASDALYLELRKQYGDLALIVGAIRADYDELRSSTGSRLGSGGGPLMVIDASGSSRGDYFGQIERRIKARLKYIQKHTNIEITDMDVDSINVDSIEKQVTEHLNSLD